MYVYCSTVHNSKDLEPTQMSINDRLDEENVAYIYHGILCSHKKGWFHVLCRDMDEAGNHHSQQTYTEQKTKHCMFSLISGCWTTRTHGHREENITHRGLLGGGWGSDSGRWGGWGGITWGEMPNVGEGEEGSKTHCHVCTYATILHVLHMYPKT